MRERTKLNNRIVLSLILILAIVGGLIVSLNGATFGASTANNGEGNTSNDSSYVGQDKNNEQPNGNSENTNANASNTSDTLDNASDSILDGMPSTGDGVEVSTVAEGSVNGINYSQSYISGAGPNDVKVGMNSNANYPSIPATVVLNGVKCNVVEIGESAFDGAYIGSVDLSEATNLKRISRNAFANCTQARGPLTIPSSVTYIGESAFARCSSLTGALTIPNSVITIGANAFDGCGFDGALKMGTSVSTIGAKAFQFCNFNGALVIPASVKDIGAYAFDACNNLKNIWLPGGMTADSYGEYVFGSSIQGRILIAANQADYNAYMAHVKFANYVSELTYEKDITFHANGGVPDDPGETTLPLMQKLHNKSWMYTKDWTNTTWTIDNSFTIPIRTIRDMYTLEGWTITANSATIVNVATDNVTHDEYFAKWAVNTFSTTGTGDDITITGFTTAYLNSLADKKNIAIVIPATINGGKVTTIGKQAFDSYVKGAAGQIYEGCLFTSLDMGGATNLITICEGAFFACGNLSGGLTIPDNVTTIGKNSFFNCPSFNGSLTIGRSVTTIGILAFWTCGFTGALTIPDSVTDIGESAFFSCKNFNGSLTIGSGVTTIAPGAFGNCSGFTGNLTIPNNVTTIMGTAFKVCSGLTQVALPTAATYGVNAFEDCNANLLIIAPNVTEYNKYIVTGHNLQIYADKLTYKVSVNFNNNDKTSNSVSTQEKLFNKSFKYVKDGQGLWTISSSYALPTAPTWSGADFQGWSLVDTNSGATITADSIVTQDTYFVKWGINTFYITGSGNAITITGFTKAYIDSNTNKANIAIDIPATVVIKDITCNVTTIGDSAFAMDTKGGAGQIYNGCVFTSLNLSNAANLTSIGDYAFQYCSGLKGSLTIGNKVKTIGIFAFNSCEGFTGNLTIPKSVTTIGDRAFQSCSGFTGSLTIPNGVTTIGQGAFFGCSRLSGVLTIPNTVTAIADNVFYDCGGFTGSLTIPNTVTSIGTKAFKFCSGLTQAELPTAATYGASAFDNTRANLVIIAPTAAAYNSYIATGHALQPYSAKLTYKVSVNFNNNDKTNNVATTQDKLFNKSFKYEVDGQGLWAINVNYALPTAPTWSGAVFQDWSTVDTNSGATITADSTVTQDKYYAKWVINMFSTTGTGNITITGFTKAYIDSNTDKAHIAIVIPATYGGGNVVAIGDNAFDATDTGRYSGCTFISLNLSNATNLITIGNRAFYKCNGFTGTLTISNNVTNINSCAFQGCSGLTGLTLGSSVKTIALGAFQECWSLTSLTLGNNVTSIGDYAFNVCSSLSGTLAIPESVNAIGNKAFNGCATLTGLTLGSNVATIGNSAFNGCSRLTQITLPTNATYGANVFNGCTGANLVIIAPNVTEYNNYIASGHALTAYADKLTYVVSVKFMNNDKTSNITTTEEKLFNKSFKYSKNTDTWTININYALPTAPTWSGAVFQDWSTVDTNSGATITADSTVTQDKYYAKWGINTFYTTGSGNAITITGFTKAYIDSQTNKANIPIVIPATYGGNVTAIGANAFDMTKYSGCTFISLDLSGVIYLITIGANAFNGCSSLSGALAIPDSVTAIGNSAFQGCAALTGLTLGRMVATIGDSAFNGCSRVNGNLTIPNLVTNIGDSAFQRCSGLTSLTLGSGVVTIGGNAFDGCSGFSGALVIPASVTNIGNNAFNGCSRFNGNLTIGSNVETIGMAAFAYCSGLSGALVIPGSVTSISRGAFYECFGLTGLTLGSKVKTIGDIAFNGCNKFTGNLVIPDSVTSIGNSAFQGCSGFNGNLTIGSNVATIGDSAFQGCSGFNGNLVIPKSVTSIGNSAFQGCSGFTQVKLPNNGTTTYGANVFNDCYINLLIIAPNVTAYNNYIVAGHPLKPYSANITYEVGVNFMNNDKTSGATTEEHLFNRSFKYVKDGQGLWAISPSYALPTALAWSGADFQGWLLDNTNKGTTITADSTVTQDKYYAKWVINMFSTTGTGNITITGFTKAYIDSNTDKAHIAIVIPATYGGNVTAIGANAFDATDTGRYSGCTFISLNLSNATNLITIGNNAFNGCSSLSGALAIPDSVTAIGNSAFQGCAALTGLTLGRMVATIGNNAFNGCSRFNGNLTIPNLVTAIGDSAFQRCSGLTSLTLGSSVVTIGANAFNGCSSLSGALVIPENVTAIGDRAFNGCATLAGLTLGRMVATIGDSAFNGCSSLSGALTIPDNVTTIGVSAFNGCSSLSGALAIPNIVTTIGASAFQGCVALTSLSLGSKVETIGDYAFSGCSSLSGALTIPDNVTTIGANVFNGCSGLTQITLPTAATYGANVFDGCTGANLLIIAPTAAAYKTYTTVGHNLVSYSAKLTYEVSVNFMNNDKTNNTATTQYKLFNKSFKYVKDGQGLWTISSSYALPTAPTWSGAEFKGWLLDNTNNGEIITVGSTVTKDIYYAKWVISMFSTTDTGNSITITGFTKAYIDSQTDKANIAIVIPATYGGNVVAIGAKAFDATDTGRYSGCTFISLNLSNATNLITIGDSAFYGCSGFTGALTIPDSVTIIDGHAFYGCSSFNALTLGSMVATIGDSAFKGCVGFRDTLAIPSSVTSIGASAFLNCSSFNVLTLGSNVETIGYAAFQNCSSLSGALAIPESVTSISASAFEGCVALTSLTLGSKVATIGNSAFKGCSGLTQVDLPTNATYSANVFNGCTAANLLIIAPNVAAYSSYTTAGHKLQPYADKLTYVVSVRFMNNDMTSNTATTEEHLFNRPFKYVKDVNGLWTINVNYALPTAQAWSGAEFKGWLLDNTNNGTTITADSIVTQDKYYAKWVISMFSTTGTGNITITGFTKAYIDSNTDKAHIAIAIPATYGGGNVVAIGDNAFDATDTGRYSGCTFISLNLSGATNLITIGANAFNGCSSLSGTLVIPDSVTAIGASAFQGCAALTGLTLGRMVVTIGANAFNGCSSLSGALTIPDNVTAIGASAFNGCVALTSLTLGRMVATIGANAFNGCSSLSGALTIPDNVTAIGASAFNGCVAFTSLTLGSKVKTIGDSAFSGCSSLSGALAIPNVVTTIGDSAFNGCSALTQVNLPNVAASVYGTSVFGAPNANRMLILAQSSQYDIYKNNANFTAYADELTYEKTVTFNVNSGEGTVPTEIKLHNKSWQYIKAADTGLWIIDSNYALPNVVKSMYRLEGWTLVANGAPVVNVATDKVTATTYYAKWELFMYSLDDTTSSGNLIITGLMQGYLDTLTPDQKKLIALDIPALLGGKPIVGIAANAFDMLTKGNALYSGCVFISLDISKATNLTFIGANAFDGCSGLTSGLTMPTTLVDIGVAAFRNCSGMTGELFIAPSVSTIGNSAFNGCSSLTSVAFGPTAALTTIGEYAFFNCAKLAGTLVLPTGVTSIGKSAFENCAALTQINLPTAISTTYGATVFDGGNANLLIIAADKAAYESYVAAAHALCPYKNNLTYIVTVKFKQNDGADTNVTTQDKLFGKSIRYAKGADSVTWTEQEYVLPTTNREEYAFSGWTDDTANLHDILTNTSATKVNTDTYYAKWQAIIFTYTVSGEEVTISGFTQAYITNHADKTKIEIVIPSVFKGNVVAIAPNAFDMLTKGGTSGIYENCVFISLNLSGALQLKTIGENAFNSASGIANAIVIPSSVMNIGASAFANCSGIRGLAFDGVSTLATIGANAFDGASLITNISIPRTITSVGANAFGNCMALTQVDLPSVEPTCYSNTAFANGNTKRVLVLADNTKYDGYFTNHSFESCKEELTYVFNVVFDSQGGSMVANHDKLYNQSFKYVQAPDTGLWVFIDTHTMPYATKDMYRLAGWALSASGEPLNFDKVKITEPTYYAKWELDIFTFEKADITSYLTITGFAQRYLDKLGVDAKKNMLIPIPAKIDGCQVVAIGANAFNMLTKGAPGGIYYGYTFTSLDLTNATNLKIIGEAAFKQCKGITSAITIPSSVTKIDANAFENCSGLAGLTFTADGALTTIGEAAFKQCNGITSAITIPANVTKIGANAFENCANISGLAFAENIQLTTISSHAFADCSGVKGALAIPANIVTIDNSAFKGCSALTDLVFANLTALTIIADYAFGNCSSLANAIAIPVGAQAIGAHAFDGCAALTQITLPNNATYGEGVFDRTSADLLIIVADKIAYDVYVASTHPLAVYVDKLTYIIRVRFNKNYGAADGNNTEDKLFGKIIKYVKEGVSGLWKVKGDYALTIPTREHSLFQGWAKTADGTIYIDNMITVDQENYYAIWLSKTIEIDNNIINATYDGMTHAYVIIGKNADVGDFSITYKLNGNAIMGFPKNAATYDVTITRLGDDRWENFTMTITGGVVIARRVVEIEWTVNNFIYSGFDQKESVKALCKNAVIGDKVNLNVAFAVDNTNVTEFKNFQTNGYFATAAFAEAQSNYALPTNGTAEKNYKIRKAPLTITAPTISINLYDEKPTYVAEYFGFVGGETVANLTGPFAMNCEYIPTSPSGDYPITLGGYVDGNYEYTYVPGVIKVGIIEVFIIWEDDVFTYNGKNQTNSITARCGNVKKGDTVELKITLDKGGVFQDYKVGGYTATASFLIDQVNYKLPAEVTKVFNMRKCKLTVTADDSEMKYNATVPTFTVKYIGFPTGTSAADLTASDLTFACDYAKDSNVGEYPITPSGYTNSNYDYTYVEGKLIVTQANSIVNPIYKGISIAVGDDLPLLELSLGDTPGVVTLVVSQTLTLGTSDYEWTFVPTDNVNFLGKTGIISLEVIGKRTVLQFNDPAFSFANIVENKLTPCEHLTYNDKETLYIVGFAEKVTLTTFLTFVKNKDAAIKVYDAKGVEVKLESYNKVFLGTGFVVELCGAKGSIIDKTTIIIMGELNGDGKVNVVDKTILQSQLLLKSELTPLQKLAADINGDGKTNMIDSTKIQAHIANVKSLYEKKSDGGKTIVDNATPIDNSQDMIILQPIKDTSENVNMQEVESGSAEVEETVMAEVVANEIGISQCVLACCEDNQEGYMVFMDRDYRESIDSTSPKCEYCRVGKQKKVLLVAKFTFIDNGAHGAKRSIAL